MIGTEWSKDLIMKKGSLLLLFRIVVALFVAGYVIVSTPFLFQQLEV